MIRTANKRNCKEKHWNRKSFFATSLAYRKQNKNAPWSEKENQRQQGSCKLENNQGWEIRRANKRKMTMTFSMQTRNLAFFNYYCKLTKGTPRIYLGNVPIFCRHETWSPLWGKKRGYIYWTGVGICTGLIKFRSKFFASLNQPTVPKKETVVFEATPSSIFPFPSL